MTHHWTVITLLIYITCQLSDAKHNKREDLIRNEALLTLGGNTTLTDKEAEVNNCLMRHKFAEVNYAFDNPQYFNFSRHFFDYKDEIRDSKVYKIIKDLPKGAALHVHDMGILSPDYLMNITYKSNLYACFDKDKVNLKFANNIPAIPCGAKWQLMSEARTSSGDVKKFDAELRKHFTLVVNDPDKVYPCIKDTWDTFMKYFFTVQPMLSHRPIWEEYFYDALKLFREHNIMYVEVRSVLPNLYELDGTVYDPLITAKAYKKTIERFKKDHPDFYGAKLIYAPPRKVDRKTLDEYLKLARRIKQDMTEAFAGFDLVGQEDLGTPLIEFVPQLSAAKDLDYFFHAGETDWYGCLTDENLVDAILLGAKRLGHAYALPKHPLLIKEVLDRNIGLEVNVISNAVLSLLRDVRNHPLATFLAQNLPVVLSSDDPGVWEADPVSDDFYVAFVGVASRLSDLRMLKELAINSLKYSAFSAQERENAFKRFNNQWYTFINNFKCSKY
ncbi:adenosine deaminase 2-like [Pectinophora gossypiella]|uniref:adenosine deaminase 2-like n=1 Tax=Pectinophora gossypiella TaxID=13191 RepID=UPI00214EFA5A|nr:adenosine deaminase 2-like [Pectinophora gossypiella]